MRVYDSPEHESLRAVYRCMLVNYGEAGAGRFREFVTHAFRVHSIDALSPFGANACRKHLERQLPLRGDFA